MLTLMTPGVGTVRPLTPETRGAWRRHLRKASYLIEPWRLDVGSGAFVLGPETLALLDLRENPCGIVDLVRAYDKDDRSTILNILEEATATSSSFCFSAIVHGPNGRVSHLFCIGNSTLSEKGAGGSLQGVFAVPGFDQ